MLLLGGLTSEETSVADVLRVAGANVTNAGTLPVALHDACAAEIGGAVYLFGGGEQRSFSGIVRVRVGGAGEPAGSLPTSASDVGCAVLGDTAYVVGGYTGVQPLRTILSWRPGQAPRVAAMLPKPLRYAAVGRVGARVLIAGGTSGLQASRDVYSFDPSSGTVRQVARLPYPLTHAAAVAADGALFVIGGRGEQPGTQHAAILAVSANGKVTVAGRLPLELSDVSAAAVGETAILAGGVDRAGRLQRGVFRLSISGTP